MGQYARLLFPKIKSNKLQATYYASNQPIAAKPPTEFFAPTPSTREKSSDKVRQTVNGGGGDEPLGIVKLQVYVER